MNEIINKLDHIQNEVTKSIAHLSEMNPTPHQKFPSNLLVHEIVEQLKSIIFPGFFEFIEDRKVHHNIAHEQALFKVRDNLITQLKRAFTFTCNISKTKDCTHCQEKAMGKVQLFLDDLPEIKKMLLLDIDAAFVGDPSAKNHAEVLFCFPGIRAIINYRIANSLLKLEIPIIPRMITELGHNETGIDIHPGATIGERFFIDHGTGVVIGETCIIKSNVKLYQGVTLGAKSFPLDEAGNPIKGIPRHPIIEDYVTIYADATILGRVTIGKNSTIGGNLWITKDIPANCQIVQDKGVSNIKEISRTKED
jgi:serine O-acetyltransferase